MKNIFFAFTFYIRNVYALLENIFGKTQFILLHLSYSFFTWQVNGNAVIKHQRPYRCIGLGYAVLRPKILLDNRLGILTQIMIAMGYFFLLLYILEKYLQLRKKQKHLLRKIFGSHYTSNRIYIEFPCDEVNFSPFIAFEVHYYILRFCQLSVKVTFKQTVKKNDCLIFLIFFVFTIVFFLQLETKEGQIVQRVHLYMWAAPGHELAAIETRAHSFNP